MDALGTRTRNRAWAWAAAWLAMSPLLGGCIGLFEPATPQPPEGTGAIIAVDYSSPEMTLKTMAAGIAAKGVGKNAYIGALADSTVDGVAFRATFDDEVARRFGGQVPTWTIDLERNFYADLIQLRSDPYQLVWSINQTAVDDEINTDDATVHRKYEVYTVGEDGNTQGRIAVGLADFYFKKILSTRWVIVRWEDHVDPTVGVDPVNNDEQSFSALRLRTQ